MNYEPTHHVMLRERDRADAADMTAAQLEAEIVRLEDEIANRPTWARNSNSDTYDHIRLGVMRRELEDR